MNKKMILMLAATMLLLTLAVSGTIAFLVTSTDAVENRFEPAYVKSSVVETFENGVKSNVMIKNDGNIDANIRAVIVVTWQDKDGNTLPIAPVEGTDYTMELDLSNGWSKDANGFYVWNEPVAPSATTGVLIEKCEQKTHIGEYRLCVEIIGSAIQYNVEWGDKPAAN